MLSFDMQLDLGAIFDKMKGMRFFRLFGEEVEVEVVVDVAVLKVLIVMHWEKGV
jgi:hypothetical protein